MKTRTPIKVALRALLALGFVLVGHYGMAQGTTQKVTPANNTVTPDGKPAARVVSKSETATVTLSDGSVVQLNAEELRIFNAKPAVKVTADGKPNLTEQPIPEWVNAYRDWMGKNPNFKASVSKEEYEFIRRNDLPGLFNYYAQHARNNSLRTAAEKQTR